MSPRWATLDGQPTRVIAHRGASGPWPEHALPAYAAALEQGADVLEPDLVVTRDGCLMVRHDRGLARSTDIAERPEFASRMREGDWPVDAFLREELRELRARQPFPQRDRSHDGRHALLDLDELLEWADDQARASGRALVLYPEIKHPSEFAASGVDPVPRFIERARAVDPARVALWVQCFELEPLLRVRDATGLPCFLLLDEGEDWREVLARHGSELAGFGVARSLLVDAAGNDSGLVAEAHARGLQVHAWTYRDDLLPQGVDSVGQELYRAFALGVDAVFCDFPATGLAARARFPLP